jgi:hypothetical protein
MMILSLDVVVASLLRSGVARRAAAFLAWIFSLSLTSSSSSSVLDVVVVVVIACP